MPLTVPWLPSLSLLFTFLLSLLAVSKFLRRSKFPLNLPPGPPKLPIIGNLHQFLGTGKVHSEAVRDLALKYGPVMQLQLGELQAVVISSAKAAEEVLKTQELNFAQRPVVHAVELMPWSNAAIIFSPYNRHWREMRKIFVSELMSPTRVHAMRPIREDQVKLLIESVYDTKGRPFDLSRKIFRMTNNVVSRAIMKECKEQDKFLSAVEEILGLVDGFGLHDMFPSFKGLLDLVDGTTRALKTLYGRLDMMLDPIIEEYRAKRKEASESEKSREEDLIDVLLRVEESGMELTSDHIKATILEFFGATSVIIATITEWTMSELIRNPKVMEKTQAEARKVLGGKTEINEKDIEGLSYLRSVIKETLRMHPPGPLYVRECREKTQIHGYDVPAKTKILVSALSIGRDPECWEDPEIFKPERFDGNEVNFKGTYYQYIPFGAGRRMCPGISFGLAIVDLPLAHLLCHFDWKLPDGVNADELNMDWVKGLSPRRKHGLYLAATPVCSSI
ncbi:Germacrene A hydroxylase [Bertholletia excelsa]